FTSRHIETLLNFANMINSFSKKQSAYELSELVPIILEETGYLNELKAEDNIENQSRIENLQELVNVIREFETDEIQIDEEEDLGALGNFLSQVALVSDIDEIKDEEKSVTLMTLHAAKGLEFPAVFLIGLEEGLFPGSKAVSYEAKKELEEERRLMYVGITRAKENLYLTYAKRRRVWGDMKFFPKSRFIEEIPPELIVEDTVSEKISINQKENNYTKWQNSNFTKAAAAKKERMNENNSAISKSLASVIVKKAENKDNFAQNLDVIKKMQGNKKTTTVIKKKQTAEIKNIKDDIKIQQEKQMYGQAAAKNSGVKDDMKIQQEKSADEDKTNVLDLINKCKQKASKTNTALYENGFREGSRVFHSSFGIGFVKKAANINGEIAYTVDFQKHGLKELDAKTANLKAF
ncbi:MAG: hypothetical protein LUE64_03985, partial [Candidatus Gastranaerophilales bacterium]|nr:hypothetical protein [Candidatus Gastranaerophilales bacterium]